MKVAMLATTGDRCGIAAYTRDLMAELQPLVDLVFVPIDEGAQPIEHYRAQAELLNQADVVHIQHEHSFWGGILPGKSAFWTLRYLITKPVVLTAHTTYSLAELLRVKQERRPLHRIAKEALLLRRRYRDGVEIAPFATSRVIVHTEEGREALVPRGAHAQDVHVIPAGIPSVQASQDGGASFRAKHDLGSARLVSLFGFISPNKGYELAINSLAELPQSVSLVIAGGTRTPDADAYAGSLVRTIEARGLTNRVRITGYLSDAEVADAMAASEVVVVPHTQATGSYSVMIALAHGSAVVASDLAIFREIQAVTPCMRLFRTGDSAHFAACLKAVLSNPVGQDEMRSRARVHAQRNSWSEVAKRTVEVYSMAVDDADKRPRHHA